MEGAVSLFYKRNNSTYSKKALLKTKIVIFFKQSVNHFRLLLINLLDPQGVNSLLDLPVIRKIVLRTFLIWHSCCPLPSLFSSFFHRLQFQKQHPASWGQWLIFPSVYIVSSSRFQASQHWARSSTMAGFWQTILAFRKYLIIVSVPLLFLPLPLAVPTKVRIF